MFNVGMIVKSKFGTLLKVNMVMEFPDGCFKLYGTLLKKDFHPDGRCKNEESLYHHPLEPLTIVQEQS